MKKNILLLLFIPFIGISQSNKHTFMGINLDQNWLTLTNQQKVAYWLQDQDKSSKYVIADCNFILKNIDTKFLNIGFKELLLIFPKGSYDKLDNLSPDLFLARITYADKNDYIFKSKNDINKVLSLLQNNFGKPVINTIVDEYSIYKWENSFYSLILTCRQDELATTVMYILK